MLTYLLMQSGAFAIVIYLQGKGEGERIEDFRGLGRTRPVLAFAMMVILLSLAGIPPLVGFFSKFYLFKLAIEQGHVTLTVIALLTSAVAAYYYLNVVALMYFKEPAPEARIRPGLRHHLGGGPVLRPGAAGHLLRGQAARLGGDDPVANLHRPTAANRRGSRRAALRSIQFRSWLPQVP